MNNSNTITPILNEQRLFPPSEEYSKNSLISSFDEYKKRYNFSIEHPHVFWEQSAQENIHFFKKWSSVFSFENYSARWFDGGFLNVSYNCLDRHVLSGNGNKIALIWESEDKNIKKFTYLELQRLVSETAEILINLGVMVGDRVAIYLPLIPEAIIAMLACTRIGAPHTVVFGGFGAHALKDRINDSGSKVLITADGGFRKGSEIKMKEIADEACSDCKSIEKILVFKRTNAKINMQSNRDFFWDQMLSDATAGCEALHLPSEHPLFIMYTSGSTGKPKGLLHTTAGYLVSAHLTSKYLFDFKEGEIFWCTADVGWITGHTYIVYGPLSNGATVFMYEGAPLFPDPGRFWEMIERHKINIFYTAPTALRTFIRFGDEWPNKYNLESLRLLGTVGEPINPEAWLWYNDTIGKKRCPIIDTWWQTETGSTMISPIPGAVPTKPGSCALPMFGVEPMILDKSGFPTNSSHGGFLCIMKPWPSMARTIYNDHERYIKTYWKEIDGVYFTGDGAHRDNDGYFWIMGRIDDVLDVSGHRLGTMEIESAIVSHPAVAECAVVGREDPLKGQSIFAFVTLKSSGIPSDETKNSIKSHVRHEIGALAVPDDIKFSEALPKTRSGKIMRRLLREIASKGVVHGDTTTLEDVSVLHSLMTNEDE